MDGTDFDEFFFVKASFLAAVFEKYLLAPFQNDVRHFRHKLELFRWFLFNLYIILPLNFCLFFYKAYNHCRNLFIHY